MKLDQPNDAFALARGHEQALLDTRYTSRHTPGPPLFAWRIGKLYGTVVSDTRENTSDSAYVTDARHDFLNPFEHGTLPTE
ncbi:MAG: hypothetical protein KDI32_03820 [Pseudomonadales bacterium]|nr:hypothetical protein [Pseudomonadales bacterium]